MDSSKISVLLDKMNRAVNNQAFPAISQIEFDLLKQHTREFYDELSNLQQAAITQIVTISEKQPEIEKPLVEKTTVEIEQPFKANKKLLLEEKEEVVSVTKITKPVEEAKPEPVKREAAVVSKSNTPSLNETIKSNGTLNEKLKTGAHTEVHRKLSTKPMKDMIDLNKRFVLLNELFKGNAEVFSATIHHIDSLNSFEEAESFVRSQLVANYYWDESSQTVRMFMKLVKQKFGVA